MPLILENVLRRSLIDLVLLHHLVKFGVIQQVFDFYVFHVEVLEKTYRSHLTLILTSPFIATQKLVLVHVEMVVHVYFLLIFLKSNILS